MASWVTESAAQTEAVGASCAAGGVGRRDCAVRRRLGMGEKPRLSGVWPRAGSASRGIQPLALVHDYGGKPPLVH